MLRTPRHLRDTVRLLDAFAGRAGRRQMPALVKDLQRVRDALTIEDGLPVILSTLKDLAERSEDNPGYQRALLQTGIYLREAYTKRMKRHTVEEDLDLIEKLAREGYYDSARKSIVDAVNRLREFEGRDRGE